MAIALIGFLAFGVIMLTLGHIEYRHEREETKANYAYDPTAETAKSPEPRASPTPLVVEKAFAGHGGSSKSVITVRPAEDAAPHPGQYQPHCDAPADRETADLCAQWAAVNATRVGNGLSATGLYFNWLGMVLSMIVGGLGIIGVFLASRAAELASTAIEAMAKVDRAYLDLRARSRRGQVGLDVENRGNSPALLLFRFSIGLPGKPADPLAEVQPSMIVRGDELIASGKGFRFDESIGDQWLLFGVGYRDVFDVSRLDWALFERDGSVWRIREDGEHEAAYLVKRYHGRFPLIA